jgi:circadian clock protein KaiC
MMDRVPTGIPELDEILAGGMPAGSLAVLAGPPGTGKTILAQQLAFTAADRDRPSLYYTTLSESHMKLRRHLSGFQFFDEQKLDTSVHFLHVTEMLQGGPSGNGEVRRGVETFFGEVLQRAFDLRPAVIVIDSFKALHHFVDPRRMREAVFDLASKVSHTGALLLLVGEYTETEILTDPEFAVADAILEVAHDVGGPVDRRYLRVRKLRGSASLMGKHAFRISDRGYELYPRIESLAPRPPAVGGGRRHFDNSVLDAMTSGGLPPGEATLIMGPSGAGKTVLSSEWISAGLAVGERCLFVSFEESQEQLHAKARSFGWNWDARAAAGRLQLMHVPPIELDIDRLAHEVRRIVDTGHVTRVVIDSLGELLPVSNDLGRFPGYLWALATTITATGASIVFTQETSALGPSEARWSSMSYLFHNVIVLRYMEVNDRVGRSLMVLKMRESAHDKRLAQYQITDGGFRITGQVAEAEGLLGGPTLRAGEISELTLDPDHRG